MLHDAQQDMLQDLPDAGSTATFSDCGLYRYTLTRIWNPDGPIWVFLMLNPSTADQFVNDPTIARCQARAYRAGAGGIIVVNLFALRSTDPRALYSAADPIGPGNDAAITEACLKAERVICAWGKHGSFRDRQREVRELLERIGVQPYVLVLNQDGSPKHPLYVSNTTTPVPWGRLTGVN